MWTRIVTKLHVHVGQESLKMVSSSLVLTYISKVCSCTNLKIRPPFLSRESTHADTHSTIAGVVKNFRPFGYTRGKGGFGGATAGGLRTGCKERVHGKHICYTSI